MPTALVPLAQGCEEMEAVTIIDILRRAGIEVTTAGLSPGEVKASRGTRLLPDTTLDTCVGREWDLVVLPGGLPGSTNLDADPRVHQLLKASVAGGKHAAAICAAPKVLANAGLLDGRRATAYPGVLHQSDLPNVRLESSAVVKDGPVITSRGPGTAMDFALVLVETLSGKAKRDEVEKGLVRG